jgi:hypothetical protein
VGDLGINNHSSAKIKINQPNNFSKRKNIEWNKLRRLLLQKRDKHDYLTQMGKDFRGFKLVSQHKQKSVSERDICILSLLTRMRKVEYNHECNPILASFFFFYFNGNYVLKSEINR